MSDEEKAYYNNFAAEAKREYDKQVVEYRATGSFKPSPHFARLEGTNIWIRRDFKNGLEKEISQYDSCQFPKRPAALEKAYEQREERSVLRRKLKLKGLINDDGTLKNGLDFEELLKKEREKKKSSENDDGMIVDPVALALENPNDVDPTTGLENQAVDAAEPVAI